MLCDRPFLPSLLQFSFALITYSWPADIYNRILFITTTSIIAIVDILFNIISMIFNTFAMTIPAVG